jgi:hypothetical protein
VEIKSSSQRCGISPKQPAFNVTSLWPLGFRHNVAEKFFNNTNTTLRIRGFQDFLQPLQLTHLQQQYDVVDLIVFTLVAT